MVHFKNTPEICYENSPIVPDTDFIIFHNIHVVQVAYVSKQKKKELQTISIMTILRSSEDMKAYTNFVYFIHPFVL